MVSGFIVGPAAAQTGTGTSFAAIAIADNEGPLVEKTDAVPGGRSMSEIAAKLRGTVKQATTVLKGQTGIYATLAKEHGEVASLLKQAEYTADSDVRHQLLRTIRHELTAHARAEERTLYEALTHFDGTRTRAAHGQSEHDEIERLLRDIFLFELGSEAATRAIADLRSFVGHHIAEEESDLFPRAQAVIFGEDARRLDERFSEEKDRELRRLELEVIV